MKLKKVLAFLCNICPLCLIARKYPESWFGKIMLWHGKYCPIWKAWEQIYEKSQDGMFQ